MGASPTWRDLTRFRDPLIPKLNNLRRAAAANLRVPPTWWFYAREIAARVQPLPPLGQEWPVIIRSASPTEDGATTSNAGQLLSVVVDKEDDFQPSLKRVIDALPCDADGFPRGAVFVQPVVRAVEAGVAFCDGFYFERTSTPGSNMELTAGRLRGQVQRGHLERDDDWSQWLETIHAVFGKDTGQEYCIDIEYARDAEGYVLLQVRPALFPLQRNPTLSLANHKEILGDLPSPWIVSALIAAGETALQFFAAVDPAVVQWQESYAVEAGERAWMNVSFFFRLMDRWGLPRTFVTQGVGGDVRGGADSRLMPRRFAQSVPRLIRLQWLSLVTLRQAETALRGIDAQIEKAVTLEDLHRTGVAALSVALRTNFAINGLISGVARARRVLHIPLTARLVTQEMMAEYARLFDLPDAAAREAGLDAWLACYGHRGPLESDPAQPRFAEMRDSLVADLLHGQKASDGEQTPDTKWRDEAVGSDSDKLGIMPTQAGERRPTTLGGSVVWPREIYFLPRRWFRAFGLIEERREWFRDELMRRWQDLRRRLLQEGARLVADGQLDAAEDAFYLRGSDVCGGQDLRAAAAAGRIRAAAVLHLDLPLTATYDEIKARLAQPEPMSDQQAQDPNRRVFPGIALSAAVKEGRAVKAYDLMTLLNSMSASDEVLDSSAILVVPSLEPSWAVIFPRVGGVVAEIGGELSHASILLREVGKPAVVNCNGILRHVETGDRLRLDGRRGVVEILE